MRNFCHSLLLISLLPLLVDLDAAYLYVYSNPIVGQCEKDADELKVVLFYVLCLNNKL